MSHRAEQVSSTVKRIVQTVLVRGLSDPRIRGMITITEIQLSKDLQHAKILVSVYPENYENTTILGLQSATMRIQRQLNDKLHMKKPPKLRFALDHQFKKQKEIMDLISKATADLPPLPQDDLSETDIQTEDDFFK